MKRIFVLITLCTLQAMNLAAQTLTKQPPATGFLSHLKVRMTEKRVVEIIGRSADRFLYEATRYVVGGDVAEIWESPDNNLVVIFKNNKIKAFSAVTPQLTEACVYDLMNNVNTVQQSSKAGPGTAERVVNAVSAAYLTAACPRVYRKPILSITAADLGLVQACDANGFMLFGMYFYTGNR